MACSKQKNAECMKHGMKHEGEMMENSSTPMQDQMMNEDGKKSFADIQGAINKQVSLHETGQCSCPKDGSSGHAACPLHK